VPSHPLVIICGSRADSGLLTPVITTALSTPSLDPVVLTLNRQWLSDPAIPRTRVCQLEPPPNLDDTPPAISRALGHYLTRFAFYFDNIQPEMVVILGDRFEVMAGALAAHVARVPIAHIHGGEITEGSYDQGFRDAITQLATLHFVACNKSKRRVVDMVFDSGDVSEVGALGCDGLTPYTGVRHGYIVAYYPETATDQSHQSAVISNISKVLYEFDPRPEEQLWLSPNPDVGFHKFEGQSFLPRAQFIERLATCRAIIGNSSSGIIEAPALGTPTINIGTRQSGRPMANTIFQCYGSLDSLRTAFQWADDFNASSIPQPLYQPYQGSNVATKIITHIVEWLDHGHLP